MSNKQLPLQEVLQVPEMTNLSNELKELLKEQTNYIDDLIKGLNNEDRDGIICTCWHIRTTNLEILDILGKDTNEELKVWIMNLDMVIEQILKCFK